MTTEPSEQVTEERNKWKNLATALFSENRKVSLKYDQEHQKLITTEGMYKELYTEFEGQLQKTMEAKKLMREENATLLAAHCDIHEVVEGQKPGYSLTITWAMVVLVFLAILAASADFRNWLGANLPVLGLIVIGFAVLTFTVFKKRKR